MKSVLTQKTLTTVFCLLASILLKAQPCQERHTTDSLEYRVLRDYMDECRKNHFDYYYDTEARTGMRMGIILLTTFTDTLGQKNWSLSYTLNDNYRAHPPAAYDVVDMNVVLIYDADAKGHRIYPPATPKLVKCIDEIVTDRVYQTRKATHRWFDYGSYKDPKSKLVKHTDYGVQTGVSHNPYRIIFKKDGTVQKLVGW
jgi:hypothetical protein